MRLEKNLKGKSVVVTGCDSGFGLALVNNLLDAGFVVVAACYTKDGAARIVNENATTVVADLSTKKGIAAVVKTAKEVAAKTNGLYGLVNNAGICLPGNIEWNPPAAYDATMAVNFTAPITLTYSLLPDLKRAKGRVVNVTSVDGFISLPSNAAYCASKHALEAYSDILRCEMGPWGVKVVVVEPASMRTPLASAFADGWLRSFKAAPVELRAEYGDEWANRIHKQTSEGMQQLMADPMITVQALLEALQLHDPPTRMVTGTFGNWLFKPLSRLPDKTRDWLLYKMTFGGPPPKKLSQSS